MKTVFLLGAGASLASGAPGTAMLTKMVRGGRHVHLHTDGRHYLSRPPQRRLRDAGEEVRRSVALINHAGRIIRRHIGRAANYEEHYFFLRQVWDDLLWEFENPALGKQVAASRRWFAQSAWARDGYGTDVRLEDACQAACNYIHDSVWRTLERATDAAQLTPWARGVHSLGPVCAAVVTLNHDELARIALRAHCVPFEDGFEPGPVLSLWKPSRFDRSTSLKLLHLHGALAWFWTVKREEPTSYRLYRVEGGDLDHLEDPDGSPLLISDNRPCIAIGTHNKVTGYFKQPFSELYGQVTRLLRDDGETDRLIMAGYGGGDKGVNLQVSDWMQAKEARSLVLVHPRPADWLKQARPHLASQWPGWLGSKRAKVLEKRFEDVTTDEWIAAATS